MRIIPAIDIIEGKCVRLTQGDYGKAKVYREDPLEVAQEFEKADLEYLHLVDLDGAKKGKVVNWDVVEDIQAKTTLKVDFGGGVSSDADVERLLDLNVNQINVGSLAVREEAKFKRWLKKFSPENFILSADVKNEAVQISGWQEDAQLSLYDLIARYDQLEYITCTDISNDGMLQGPNFMLYKKIKARYPKLKVIASGGITTIEDLEKLKYIDVYGAIIGKAIYEGKITLEALASLKNF